MIDTKAKLPTNLIRRAFNTLKNSKKGKGESGDNQIFPLKKLHYNYKYCQLFKNYNQLYTFMRKNIQNMYRCYCWGYKGMLNL